MPSDHSGPKLVYTVPVGSVTVTATYGSVKLRIPTCVTVAISPGAIGRIPLRLTRIRVVSPGANGISAYLERLTATS
jgi:hypothetical protein